MTSQAATLDLTLVFVNVCSRPPGLPSDSGQSDISEAPTPVRQRLGDGIDPGSFDIPRAKIAAPREPRRVIRSPSGRQTSATQDNLMREYKVRQKNGMLPTTVTEEPDQYGSQACPFCPYIASQ